ncbi:MAG: NAD(P)-binding protein [Arenicellales bacterium]
MKVCVVGAGVSGLVVVKELLDEGHDVVCFEQEAKEGGVFNHPKGIAYDSMYVTVSQYFTSYSSMPPIDEDQRAFWSRKRIFKNSQRGSISSRTSNSRGR